MDTCPGCVGRGSGTRCGMCNKPVPAPFVRLPGSPREYNAACAGCREGRTHSHIRP